MKFAILCSFLVGSLTAAEPSDGPLPLSKDYWKDPAFLKSFNGSYRINARIEPNVTSEERGVLVSIQPLMAEGQREEALKKLNASPQAKTSAAIAFNRGNIEFELGQMKEAAESYLRALEIFPSFRRAHRNLGFVYARGNDWEKAIPELEESIRLGDQDAATYGQLAYGRMHNEQYVSALQAYKLAQVTQPNSVDWKAGVAQCLQFLQQNEEALALIDEVIKVRPNEVSYYLLQSSIQLSMDQPDAAITNLDFVRRLGHLDADNHLLLATLHLRAGSVDLARPLMMAALKMEAKPSVVAALNSLEFVGQVRDWKLAREVATAIQECFPKIEAAPLLQQQKRLGALIDIESGENPGRGAGVLELLIKLDPLDGSALIMLARYRISEKRSEEAVMLLQQAARIEGHIYNAKVELAQLYVSLARYTVAVAQLEAALQLQSNEELETYLTAVQHLVDAAE